MSQHPSPINSLKLRVIQGSNTYEKVIPSSSSETTNSFPITNQTFPELLNAFNSQPLGTIFNPSIVATYTPGTFETGDVLSTPSTQANFVPRQITPTFQVADIPEKNTADEPFSVADLVTKTGTGVVSYSSSVPSVASVISSSGLVTIAGAGETNITFSLAASADGVYKAVAPITKTLKVNLISRASNNVTIQYMGTADDVPNNMPLFIQADPRNTGSNEWFAVVKDGMNDAITNYAKGLSGSSTPFTPPGQTTSVPFNNIVTTLMTDMSYIFANVNTFNQDISSWDTSNVTTMSSMFLVALAFNQDISNWDTAKVTNMREMFFNDSNNSAFNQNIGSWNVSNVTNMDSMLRGANKFNNGGNSSIGSWNTAKVTNMNQLFYHASVFNQNIGAWDTSKVTIMNLMFWRAAEFNQNIGSWDTSNVTDMRGMFQEASKFNNGENSSINNWNTSNVTDMRQMFQSAIDFNQNIGSWDTSNVTNMFLMFSGATTFNQNISNWEVTQVTNFSFFRTFSALINDNTPPRFVNAGQ